MRHTRQTPTDLIYDAWLIFCADGTMRLNRAAPHIGANERSMFVSIKLPKSAFRIPTLRADISVDDPGADGVIHAQIQCDAEQALRTAIDADIVVTVHDQSTESPHDTEE